MTNINTVPMKMTWTVKCKYVGKTDVT